MKSKPTRRVRKVKAWATVDQFGDIENVATYQLKALEHLRMARDLREQGVFITIPIYIHYELPKLTKKPQ